jgi:hypothetical protein
VFSAQIAVDQPCSGPTPTPTPTPPPILTTIGIDTDPSQTPANTATSLGSIETCRSTTSGQQFTIDLFITDVTDLTSWGLAIQYNPAILNVTAVNVSMFQAANPGSNVVNFSDPVPDASGSFYVIATDLGTADSGSGVLARITLTAVGSGLSDLSVAFPELRDKNGAAIGDNSGDGYFDGSVFSAQIAVDQLCSVTATLGVDADPSQSPANTATSLGSIEVCRSMASSQQFDVDLYITDVSDLLGWSTTLRYDPAVLSVTAVDVNMFQAANPGSDVFSLSDATPNSSGSFFVGAMDLGAVDSGSGVLARITLTAVGPGVSGLIITYPELKDESTASIGDTNGDGYFDGSISYGQIAVDQTCPPGTPTPFPTPTPGASPTPSPTPTPTPPPGPTTIGIDADPSQSPANTAKSLGSIEACRSVTSGQGLYVDIFITNVVDLLAWDLDLLYDPAVLNVAAINVNMFQGSGVFNVSEVTPDSDGSFYAGAADLGALDSGSGVLARITLAAVGPDLTITLPQLKDNDNNPIGDIDGDGYFDGLVSNGRIAVDQACPPDTDSDTLPDSLDNCPLDYNPDQQDVDADGVGDVCDPDTQASSAVSDSVTGAVSVTNPSGTIGFVGTTAVPGSTLTIVEDTDAAGTIEYTAQGIAIVGNRFDLVSPSPITGTVTNVIDFADPGITQAQLDSLTITKQMPGGPMVIPHTVVSTVVTPDELIIQATIEYQLVDDALMTALAPLDSDDDGVFDRFDINGDGDFLDAGEEDNCRLVPNPSQADNEDDGIGDECDPDDDNDAFSDLSESYVGTDPFDACADDPSDSAWPLDIDNDTLITTVNDILNFRGRIGATPGQAVWWQRLDFNGDGLISVTGDLLDYRGTIGRTCSQ